MAVMFGPQRDAKDTQKRVVRVAADTAGALDEAYDRRFDYVDYFKSSDDRVKTSERPIITRVLNDRESRSVSVI